MFVGEDHNAIAEEVETTYIVDLPEENFPDIIGKTALELQFSSNHRNAVARTLADRVNKRIKGPDRHIAIARAMEKLDREWGEAGAFAYEVPLEIYRTANYPDGKECKVMLDSTDSQYGTDQTLKLSEDIQLTTGFNSLESIKEAERYLKFYRSKMGINQ